MFYWLLKTVVLGPVLRVLFRPWATGLEHVPERGGAILASNHLSFSDSVFLPLVLDRRVTFLAKSDYFTGRGAKGRATALFFRLADQLPVDRTGGRASEAALRTGLRVLRRGQLLGIYPEGTRSPDGRLYRGKTGVARMALEAGVPVLPVAMVDTAKAQPIGRKIPKIVRVGVRIGAPLDFSRYEGMEDDRFVLRAITDEIMYELMQLSGQEYVDIYASVMKERLAAAKRGKPLPAGVDAAAASDDDEAAAPRAERPSGRPVGVVDGGPQPGEEVGSQPGEEVRSQPAPGAAPDVPAEVLEQPEVEDAVADLGPASGPEASSGPPSSSGEESSSGLASCGQDSSSGQESSSGEESSSGQELSSGPASPSDLEGTAGEADDPPPTRAAG